MPFYLGLDPGTRNFGYALFLPPKQVTFGMLSNPLGKGSGRVETALVRFISEIHYIVYNNNVKMMFAERYNLRGFRNPNVELVNLMLGVLVGTYGDEKIGLITPAEWKTYFKNKIGNTDDIYKAVINITGYKKRKLTIHSMDALLLSLYACGKKFKITKEKNILKFVDKMLSNKIKIEVAD